MRWRSSSKARADGRPSAQTDRNSESGRHALQRRPFQTHVCFMVVSHPHVVESIHVGIDYCGSGALITEDTQIDY